MIRACKISNCNSQHHAKGYCGKHYGILIQAKQKPLYKVWSNMHSRCNTPSSTGYEHYGGRGIKVCDRWKNYKLFELDMGTRPAGTTLDRINNDGNYEPSNCRWSIQRDQVLNRRMNSNNSTGHVGIHWFKAANKWSAHITSNYKTVHLGLFTDINQAILARKNAEMKYHG